MDDDVPGSPSPCIEMEEDEEERVGVESSGGLLCKASMWTFRWLLDLHSYWQEVQLTGFEACSVSICSFM